MNVNIVSKAQGLGFMCSCIECDRVFDLSNEVDAAEWKSGHVCSAKARRSQSLVRQLRAEAGYILDLARHAERDGDSESSDLLIRRAEALEDEAANLVARAKAVRTLFNTHTPTRKAL
jgi:hypothetical protein